MNKFAERLVRTLQTSNMAQSELARRIGMSQGIVNNYCTGKREPSLNALMLICKALDETSDYLIGLTES